MRGFRTDPSYPAGLRLADDLPEPDPHPDEAVVEVSAFAVNPGELALIRQRPNGFQPGQDIAGTVVHSADDGSGPPVGARVVGYPDWKGWADRVAVPVNSLAVLDDEVTFAQAATLPVAGLTALRALRLGGSLLGRRILITGATGGVGQFALQLAAASGAEVTAQVRSADRGAMAYQLGASKVVTDLEDAGPFHLILDGVAGPQLPQAVRLLEPGGTLVLYGGGKAPSPIKLGDFYYNGAHNAKIVGFTSTSPEAIKGQDLALLVTLVAQERLLPLIGWTGDWSRTSEALAALANHTFRGKAVLVR